HVDRAPSRGLGNPADLDRRVTATRRVLRSDRCLRSTAARARGARCEWCRPARGHGIDPGPFVCGSGRRHDEGPRVKGLTLATEPSTLPAWLDLTSPPVSILTYRDAFMSAHAPLTGAIREAQARRGARRLDIALTAPPEAFVWRDRRAGLWEIKR